MATATYELIVDWNNDGVFGDANEDITTDVVSLEWSHGRDYASQLTGRSTAAQLVATLLNTDGKYASFNAASVLTGNLLPGRRVRLRMTSSALTTVMFFGFLDSIEPRPSLGHLNTAVLRAVGPLAWIGQRKVSVPIQSAVRTDVAMGVVLDEIGWATTTNDRVLDVGDTTMARWWTGGQRDALNALRDIEESENGFLREGKGYLSGGQVVWERRQHRLAGAHLTAQATYSDGGGAGVIPYRAVQQQDPLKEIFNRIEAEVRSYSSGATGIIWTHPEAVTTTNVLSLAPGQTRVIWAQYPTPDASRDIIAADRWKALTTADYRFNSSQGGGGADLQANLTVSATGFDNAMRIEVRNAATGQPGYLTLLQARGVPLRVSDPAKYIAEEATSQTRYGERTWPVPGPWIPDGDEAQDYVNFVLGIYKDPIPVLALEVWANESSAMLDEARTRDVSDRVNVVVTSTGRAGANLGINEHFFVEHIAHRVTRERSHSVTLQLSPADAYGRAIVLDTGPPLDTGVLGY